MSRDWLDKTYSDIFNATAYYASLKLVTKIFLDILENYLL